MELFYFSKSKEDEKELSDFLKLNASESGAEFLQSNEWGDFLELSEEEVIRVGVKEIAPTDNGQFEKIQSKKILLVATLVKKKILGDYFYWYAPRGPIFNLATADSEAQDNSAAVFKKVSNHEIFEFFLAELKKIDSRALFLRFEPQQVSDGNNLKKTINLQPAETLILDLRKSEEELLAEMHQKTRYNIRLAEKKGIIIKEGNADSPEDLKEFWRLLKTTGERDNFRLHSFLHYEKLLSVNRTAPGFIKLFFAKFEGKNIAGGIFCFYGDKVTYLHGASDNEFRSLMAPYLLQFSLVKKAQAENYLYYDFFGIDEKKWPGVTRFKLGFGGSVFDYAGTYDLILRPFLYRIYEFLRKIRRAV